MNDIDKRFYLGSFKFFVRVDRNKYRRDMRFAIIFYIKPILTFQLDLAKFHLLIRYTK